MTIPVVPFASSQLMRWMPVAPIALPSDSITHQTSSFDSPIFFRNSCSCSRAIAMRLARNRVTSMSANQRTKCSASFSRAGRRVTLSPRSSGPNIEAARIAAHGACFPGLSDRPLRERGREQHLVTALVADVELRADPRQVNAKRVGRNAEPIGERRAIEPLPFAREQLHLAEDAELPPRQSDGSQVERRLVKRR